MLLSACGQYVQRSRKKKGWQARENKTGAEKEKEKML